MAVDIEKSLLIGSLTVLMSSQILRLIITNDNHLAIIRNLIGTALIIWCGIGFAGKARDQKNSAIPVFFIAGSIHYTVHNEVLYVGR